MHIELREKKMIGERRRNVKGEEERERKVPSLKARRKRNGINKRWREKRRELKERKEGKVEEPVKRLKTAEWCEGQYVRACVRVCELQPVRPKKVLKTTVTLTITTMTTTRQATKT